jgi:hypothetical protein
VTAGAPQLSIVIPAYDEAARIVVTLRKTLRYLAERHPESEVLASP